jgi:hypothetical protein
MISTLQSVQAAHKYLHKLDIKMHTDKDFNHTSYNTCDAGNIDPIQIARNKRNIESWKAKDRVFWVRKHIGINK